uniref:Methyltransferase type 11 domain-containing protein n=1 Tax=Heterosigma akashiwo TaxID=2829 RepID=A0A6V1RY07_HETAK
MENVHSIYESIAGHWNHTRGQRKVLWPGTKSFIESLPPGSLVADIGCGDGKYFGANPEAMVLGCDRSQRLLDICVDKNQFEVICCDALKLPYRDNTFDAVICVAVLHHLSTEVHRINALKELVRITRPGGLIEIQVWAYEQEPDSRRKFDQPDCFVPWHLQRKYASAQDLAAHGPPNQNGLLRLDRYVHAFREGELRGLCARHLGGRARVVQPEGYARSNWHLRLQKT